MRAWRAATVASALFLYALSAVYVKDEHDTVSPGATINPLLMLMSDPLAATPQWITTVPPLVSSVAVATALALPVALVSLLIAPAVAVPPLLAPKAVAAKLSVATAAPGAPTEPANLNLSMPLAPSSAVTALVAALRAAVLCVTAMF